MEPNKVERLKEEVKDLLLQNEVSFRQADVILGSLMDDFRHRGGRLLRGTKLEEVAKTPR